MASVSGTVLLSNRGLSGRWYGSLGLGRGGGGDIEGSCSTHRGLERVKVEGVVLRGLK